MTDRARNIANDLLDCVETAITKWTRQKKAEERHPGNVRYRASRMTREPRTTQKERRGWCWKPPTWRLAATAPCQPWRGKSTTRRAPGSWRLPTDISRKHCVHDTPVDAVLLDVVGQRRTRTFRGAPYQPTHRLRDD